MRTAIVYLLAIGTVVLGAVFGFPRLLGAGAEGMERGPRSELSPVIVAEVLRRPMLDQLEALGTVRANESVDITPNRADHVAAIHFEGGQQVERGQLLVEMRADEEKALLTEALAMRDDLDERFGQLQALFEQGATSGRELDNAHALFAAAQAKVISLQAAIADREVRAPFAGTLGFRRISEGAYLQTSSVITTLDDLSVVKLDFTIPETWLSHVQSGMTLRALSDAWPDRHFEGQVVLVDTRLDARTRSVSVRAHLPNPDRLLRPGMLLKVVVERGEESVLQVPEEALVPVGQDNFVWIVGEDDVAQQVPVVIGRRQVGVAEVLQGLKEGDRVVVEGILKVRAGAKVQVVSARKPETGG